MKDAYKTIENPSEETLFKDRNSKFFGYAFPVLNEDDVKNALEILKKKHHAARHFCYAWQFGTDKIRFRANDDGEPNNSAGMPIYGQIQAFEVIVLWQTQTDAGKYGKNTVSVIPENLFLKSGASGNSSEKHFSK